MNKKSMLTFVTLILFIIGSYEVRELYLSRNLQHAYTAILNHAPQILKTNLTSSIVNRFIKISPTTESTLLIQAIIHNPDDPTAHELIKVILGTSSVDPNLAERIQQRPGRAPINWAVERGNEKAVALLAQAQANLNAVDPITKKSPLAFVQAEKEPELRKEWHLDVIENILLHYGAQSITQ